MFAKYKATQELQAMIDRYRNELDQCDDKDEEAELIDVVENLEWIIKEINSSDDTQKSNKTKWTKA